MKKRYLVLILLILAALALPMAANAASSGKCGENLTWSLDNAGVLTISGSGEMDDYDYDFENNANTSPWGSAVKQVKIQKGVTSIGDCAFICCEQITSVSLPSGLKTIGGCAFDGCKSLKSVTIPKSVTSIGSIAFARCSSLTSVTVPGSVSSMDATFQGCLKLASVTLQEGVQRLTGCAFDACFALKKISIPASVTSMDNAVFNQIDLSQLTIRCYGGSAAEKFAKAKGIATEVIRPDIIAQPVDTTTNEGKTASFKVSAVGATSYQWFERAPSASWWNECTGSSAKKATLKVTASSTNNGHQFRCLVKNSGGSVYTDTVRLTVKFKPVITTQPSNAKVNEGSKVTFKVAATGATGYQWYYRTSASGSWKKCAGSSAATASRPVTAKAAYNGYQYRCLVKNSAGSVASNAVTLTVNPKPVITGQPKSAKVNEDGKVTFKVTAKHAASYQWYYRTSSAGKWQKCAGSSAVTASRTVTAKAAYNGYQYRCLVKNSVGSVASKTVTLTVNPKPVITAQPKSAKANEGSKATFKVAAKGAASFQWYYRTSSAGEWQKCSGSDAVTASRTVIAKAKYSGYQYRCLVKNSAGSVFSSVATLTVNPTKPVITAQPQNASVTAGKKAAFKVTAQGASSYQWYYRKSSDGVWQKCSGASAATASYSFTTAAKHNGYQYRCLVKNSAGGVYTNTVTVKVK